MYGQHLTTPLSQKKLWQLQLNRDIQTEKCIYGFLGGVVLPQISVIYNIRETLSYGYFTLGRAPGVLERWWSLSEEPWEQ